MTSEKECLVGVCVPFKVLTNVVLEHLDFIELTADDALRIRYIDTLRSTPPILVIRRLIPDELEIAMLKESLPKFKEYFLETSERFLRLDVKKLVLGSGKSRQIQVDLT